MIVVFLAGAAAGYFIRGMLPPPGKNPPAKRRVLDVSTTWWTLPGSGHIYGLRSIDAPRLLAICHRVNRGQALTYRALTGRGKLLSRAQFEQVRRELLDRRFMARLRDGSLAPTPEGRLFFGNFPTLAARMHRRTEKRR